ncbi:retrovirus-related pol polyprotein from transposon TNT 1-94 [Tanacetum coccineum]
MLVQPDEFVDPDKPNYVYKLKKALYGLKQAPRAWYDMLSSFLISNDFSKGSVDPTLFIRRGSHEHLLYKYMSMILSLMHLPMNLVTSGYSHGGKSPNKMRIKKVNVQPSPIVTEKRCDIQYGKLNIMLWSGLLCSSPPWMRYTTYRTSAVGFNKFQSTVKQRRYCIYAATTYNIPDPAYRGSVSLHQGAC